MSGRNGIRTRLGSTVRQNHFAIDSLRTEGGVGPVERMHTIKRVLDPHNILDPGKNYVM
jgi:FAD/FMN-containing dehydrogenase